MGKKLEGVELADLGRAHRVVSTKDTTTVVDGKGDKKTIDSRVAQIKTQIKKTDSDFDKEKLQERLGKLASGVAVIKVGAPTESAQKELKQRVEDAVAATRAAMEEGIVPGGGMALFNVYRTGYKKAASREATVEDAAARIIARALRAPLEAIVSNSGQTPDVVMSDIMKTPVGDSWIGFNALTNQIGNLKEAGIIDPLKVTRTAFMNAVSVAANYLTVGVAITNVPEKKTGPMPGGSGMGGGMMDGDY